VVDAAGAPLVGGEVVARGAAGVTVAGTVARGPEPGSFDVPIAWAVGTPSASLHVVANGADEADTPAVPLPVPPAPPAPRRDFLSIGVLAGGALASSPYPAQPAFGPAVAGEIGWVHTFPRWTLGVAGRVTWEHSSFDSAPDGDDLYGAGIPVTARLGPEGRTWRPYFGVEPALVVDVVHHAYAPVGVGGSGFVGVAYKPRFAGEAFFELGYRLTNNFEPYASESRDALFAHLGYHLSL
jgi:hypothetical protein